MYSSLGAEIDITAGFKLSKGVAKGKVLSHVWDRDTCNTEGCYRL